MSRDNRDTLEILKAELEFIEKGGYGRSVKTPWQPTSIFQDAPICLNFADLDRPHPCEQCLLIDFVPPEARVENVPCHHIPLTPKGETIDGLEWSENQRNLEEAVKGWLRTTIAKLEKARAPQSIS
jgi:hypothetical protein